MLMAICIIIGMGEQNSERVLLNLMIVYTLSGAIKQYTHEEKYIRTFPSVKSAALSIGVSPSYISTALSGKIKLAKGYMWKGVKK
jgi:hypothetical protein